MNAKHTQIEIEIARSLISAGVGDFAAGYVAALTVRDMRIRESAHEAACRIAKRERERWRREAQRELIADDLRALREAGEPQTGASPMYDLLEAADSIEEAREMAEAYGLETTEPCKS